MRSLFDILVIEKSLRNKGAAAAQQQFEEVTAYQSTAKTISVEHSEEFSEVSRREVDIFKEEKDPRKK